MKITILQEDLLFALSSVSRFISLKAQLPVLANILLVAEKGKLILSATNLETGISLQIGAKIEEEGKTTVPAKVFLEMISNISAGQVTLEEKEGQMLIEMNPVFSASLNTIPASEFPNIPKILKEKDITISQNILKTLTSQVTFAAATDETRPILTGILLSLKNNPYAVTTDGFRLSLKFLQKDTEDEGEEIDVKKEEFRGQDVLIPAKSVEELVRVLSGLGEEEKVDVGVSKKEGQIIFSAGPVILTGRLFEGDFPNYERIMPKKWNHKATFNKDDLVRAVKVASVFSKDSASIIRIKIEEGKLTVKAESQQYGKGKTVLDAKTEGEEVEVAFNYRYLLEFLNSVKDEEVSFSIESSTSPGVFEDTKDPSYKHLIMPVRLQG